ncbi:MAG TPA: L-asparaginase 1, partial [Alteromonas macleodii]|nr:L-asparaginase 1 [Alteromonas macleodii]
IRLKAGELAKTPNNTLTVSNVKAQPIGMVSLYPGIAPEVIKNTLQQPVNALILLSYGVGNAPQNPELIAQLKYAKAREIPVLNCTQCMRGRVNMGGYATGHGLQEVGVLSGSDMTPEAALAKLHYLLSKGLPFEEIIHLLTQNLRGELSD